MYMISCFLCERMSERFFFRRVKKMEAVFELLLLVFALALLILLVLALKRCCDSTVAKPEDTRSSMMMMTPGSGRGGPGGGPGGGGGAQAAASEAEKARHTAEVERLEERHRSALAYTEAKLEGLKAEAVRMVNKMANELDAAHAKIRRDVSEARARLWLGCLCAVRAQTDPRPTTCVVSLRQPSPRCARPSLRRCASSSSRRSTP